jgi:hypothetical protein
MEAKLASMGATWGPHGSQVDLNGGQAGLHEGHMEANLASMEDTWRPSWLHMEAKLASMEAKVASMQAKLAVDLHGGHMKATMGGQVGLHRSHMEAKLASMEAKLA